MYSAPIFIIHDLYLKEILEGFERITIFIDVQCAIMYNGHQHFGVKMGGGERNYDNVHMEITIPQTKLFKIH